MNRSTLVCALFLLAGCGSGTVIGSGPTPTAPPVTPNVSFEYSVPTANANPLAIAAGADGFLYFTENAASKIGRLSTGGSFTELATKTAAALPTGITLGPNGSMWWAQPGAHSIATVTSGFAAADITEYAIPWANSAPQNLARGVVQNSLYFTDPGANAIGRVLTDGTFAGPFTIPTAASNPVAIVTGPDNKMWFTENAASKIGILDPATNAISETPIAAGAHPDYIVQGPDGAMWFTENVAGAPKLGRLTTSMVYTEFPLTGAQSATGLLVDLFGDLVIADPAASKIGIFKIGSQNFTEYATKTAAASPDFVTLGPDGRIYFTEPAANKIGQFSYF